MNDDPTLPNFESNVMYSTLKILNFVFTNYKGFTVLIEKENLLVCRQNYLYDICKYREDSRTVYYIDEMLLKASD